MKAEEAALLFKLTNADSVQEIVDVGAQLLGNPVFVRDVTDSIHAYSTSVEVRDAAWEQIVIQDQRRDSAPETGLSSGSGQEDGPSVLSSGLFEVPHMIHAIGHSHRPLGTVVLVSLKRPFVPGDRELFGFVCEYITKLFRANNTWLSSRTNAVENLLTKALTGFYFEDADLQERLKPLGWEKRKFTHLLAFQAPSETRNGFDRCAEELNRDKNCIASRYGEHLLCVVTEDRAIENWPSDSPVFRQPEQYGFLTGISPEITSLTELPTAYAHALRALKLGSILHPKAKQHFYEQLSVYDMIHVIGQTTDLKAFCHRRILFLHEYDQAHRSELVKTLQVYLENVKEISRVSECLELHRNTVRYRLNKCEELLDDEFRDGALTFHYMLSLKILEYLDKMKEKDG